MYFMVTGNFFQCYIYPNCIFICVVIIIVFELKISKYSRNNYKIDFFFNVIYFCKKIILNIQQKLNPNVI